MSASSNLDPILDHNRKRFDRLLRWKRLIAVLAIPGLTAVAVFSPPTHRTRIVMGSFGALILVFVSLEVARFLIFKRDLREREEDQRQ